MPEPSTFPLNYNSFHDLHYSRLHKGCSNGKIANGKGCATLLYVCHYSAIILTDVLLTSHNDDIPISHLPFVNCHLLRMYVDNHSEIDYNSLHVPLFLFLSRHHLFPSTQWYHSSHLSQLHSPLLFHSPLLPSPLLPSPPLPFPPFPPQHTRRSAEATVASLMYSRALCWISVSPLRD